MNPTIGVLGGIGPESSAEFYKRFVELVQKHCEIKSNTDYPHIIIESIPAPELLSEKPDLTMYKAGIRNLEKAGADFIVIVCNTAYVFYDELQRESNVPILDLRKSVGEFLSRRSVFSLFLALSEQQKVCSTQQVVKRLTSVKKTAGLLTT